MYMYIKINIYNKINKQKTHSYCMPIKMYTSMGVWIYVTCTYMIIRRVFVSVGTYKRDTSKSALF